MKKLASSKEDRLPEESLIAELEAALIEYVEKFGPTERARHALSQSSLWYARPKDDPKIG